MKIRTIAPFVMLAVVLGCAGKKKPVASIDVTTDQFTGFLNKISKLLDEPIDDKSRGEMTKLVNAASMGDKGHWDLTVKHKGKEKKLTINIKMSGISAATLTFDCDAALTNDINKAKLKFQEEVQDVL